MKPLFELGQVVATPGALEALDAATPGGLLVQTYLDRHSTGDWGDLDDDDKRQNNMAVIDGSRIFSAYKLSTGAKIWVITEADRSSTTILLPEEY